MIKEEKIPIKITTGGQQNGNNPKNQPNVSSYCEKKDDDITSDSSEDNNVTPNLPAVTHHAAPSRGERFRCPKCGKCFAQRAKLKSHQRGHKGRNRIHVLNVGN
ncbi:unnamed protein product, partial [Staurois parvus]